MAVTAPIKTSRQNPEGKPPIKVVAPTPARFQASRTTLLADRFMTQFIKVGGLLVIAAVLGIFIFILVQIIPLFQGAQVTEIQSVPLPKARYSLLGADEWSELPFLLRSDGKVVFVDLKAGGKVVEVDAGVEGLASSSASGEGERATSELVTSANYNASKQEVILGTSTGLFSIVPLNYTMDHSGGQPKVVQKLQPTPFTAIGKPGAPIFALDYGDSGDAQLVAAMQQAGDQAELHAVRITRKRTLFGMGKPQIDRTFNLTSLLSGKPVQLLVSRQADSIIVLTSAGDVEYLFSAGDHFEKRQVFRPFADQKDATIASIDFLFGDVSLVVTSITGENRVFSLYRKPGSYERTFGLTHDLKNLQEAATFYNSSLRNKAFLTGGGQFASLRYSTTESVRWEAKLPFTIEKALIGGKYNRLLFLDKEANLHVFRLNDPHPDTSFKALFGKVWYEGYSAPSYQWQSTGGTDDFEPKYSLIPLIIGTLKGTIYAMLFAVPIALLAALYTSQFLDQRYKMIVKPTMEVMASLPSVVLGFLAALWLAPLIERRIPSILIMIVMVPVAGVAFGYWWSSLPIRYRRLIRGGYEFIAFLPILLGLLYLSWKLGPLVEQYLFRVTDPTTGGTVADFRLWWPQVTGASFEQRNSLVVGFMMGFAVIPIIFTISEDALSNVPAALRSGSLALGASRWQTALRVIVPTASAGIFSALMVGLGRAVGETMIVVMATGNTPIMDLNIFSGMRTLSANIAVELPEAPEHSSLYRTLFLGAMLLFLMTFLVNTGAELLRQHLREKYKTI